jgi:hypothetical protein
MTIARIPAGMPQALTPGQRQALERFYGALGNHDVDLVDRALAPPLGRYSARTRPRTRPAEGIKPIFRMLLSAFPDLSHEIVEVLAEPGGAAVRVRITATHRGNLFGVPASGKTVRFAVHEFHLPGGPASSLVLAHFPLHFRHRLRRLVCGPGAEWLKELGATVVTQHETDLAAAAARGFRLRYLRRRSASARHLNAEVRLSCRSNRDAR